MLQLRVVCRQLARGSLLLIFEHEILLLIDLWFPIRRDRYLSIHGYLGRHDAQRKVDSRHSATIDECVILWNDLQSVPNFD